MPKSTYLDKATSICYNCQGKGHFSSECRSKKDKFSPSTSASSSSSRDAKYLKPKEKYRKIKTQRKGRGLVAEDHDWLIHQMNPLMKKTILKVHVLWPSMMKPI